MSNKIKYTGKNGEFIDGIPDRDLTEDEWEELSKEQKKLAVKSGLYHIPEETASPSKKLDNKSKE